jgi:Replication-relaxation
MDAIVRKDRFSYAPVIKDGKPKAISEENLGKLHLAILDTLTDFRLLSADYIAPLAGTKYKWALPLINELKSEPNRYIKICDDQYENKKNHHYNPLQLELAPRGIRFQEGRGYKIPPRKPVLRLRHQIMDDQIQASLVLGAQEHEDHVRVIWREQLLKSDRMPQKTREKAFPEHIDVAGPDGKSRQLWPDGKMFLVHNKVADFYSFVHGYEADTGTESIATRIREKFENYIYVVNHNLQETYFGADENYYFMFLFSNQNRLKDAMTLFEEMTAKKTSLRKHGLFKIHPLYNDQPKPRATGHMISEPFLRVGYLPLNFLAA